MGEAPAMAPVAIRYRAFLSYSHADTAWAKWLHASLERYSVDKDLIGQATPLGPVLDPRQTEMTKAAAAYVDSFGTTTSDQRSR